VCEGVYRTSRALAIVPFHHSDELRCPGVTSQRGNARLRYATSCRGGRRSRFAGVLVSAVSLVAAPRRPAGNDAVRHLVKLCGHEPQRGTQPTKLVNAPIVWNAVWHSVFRVPIRSILVNLYPRVGMSPEFRAAP
jgi:hypothetical protein